MSFSLDILSARASRTILVDNYLEYGLLAFDGRNIWLIAGMYSGNDGKAYCKQQIELFVEPALPSEEKFNALFVNKSGSRVALSSVHSVFVIEIPDDLWCRQSITANPLMDYVGSSAHCRGHCVGANAILTRSASNILKIQWYWKERHDYGHHISNKLAVLHDDNVVRLYDTDVSCTTPTLMIDFKSVLGLGDLSSTRSFGIYNYIASFNFGPSIVCTDDEHTRLKTLFAIDNECGDIYIAVYSDNRVHEVQGPFTLTSTEHGYFADGDVLDILYIHHQERNTLPVFSLISSKGHITHFIAIPLEQEISDGHIEFAILPYENFSLPSKPLPHMPYCLRNDLVNSGQYFVFCGANLFSVSIQSWAHLLSKLLSTGLNSEKSSSDLPDSKVHHIFHVLGGTETVASDDVIIAAAIVKIICNNYPDASVDDFYSAFGEKDIAFIASTFSKQLLYRFTKLEDIWNNKEIRFGQHRTANEENVQDYLLIECSKILESRVLVPKYRLGWEFQLTFFFMLNKSVTEAEAIAVATAVIDALMTNMEITKAAFIKAQNIITEDLEILEKVNTKKLLCTERLLRVLSAYVDLKNRIYKIHCAVAKLQKRGDELGSGLMPKVFPLSSAEKALAEMLETLRIEVEGITQRIPYLANELAVKRRERFGPVRSFSASVSAQKFMLSKNTADINEIVRWTENLNKKIKLLYADITAEESLPDLPKPTPHL